MRVHASLLLVGLFWISACSGGGTSDSDLQEISHDASSLGDSVAEVKPGDVMGPEALETVDEDTVSRETDDGAGMDGAEAPTGLWVGMSRTEITPAFEPYVDENGNHHYDPGEPFEDLDQDGVLDTLYVGGFGLRNPTGVHDALWARTLALEVSGEVYVLTSLDVLGLSMKRIDEIKQRVLELPETRGLLPERIVIASTHTHQGPDTMGLFGEGSEPGWDEAFLSMVVERTVADISKALSQRSPARLYLASTTDTGDLVRDIDVPEIKDPYVGVMQFRAPSGEVLCTLVSIANHPEACWGENTLISSDYPHFLRENLESEFGGMAIYFSADLGLMQTPTEWGEPGFERAEYIGQSYAQRVIVALADEMPISDVDLLPEDAFLRIQIPLENPELYIGVVGEIAEGYFSYLYQTDQAPCDFFGCIDLPVFLLRLGQVLTLVTLPGEVTPELIVGGIVSPEGYEGEYPDAPLEPHLEQGIQTETRFIIGLAGAATGYFYPKRTFDPEAHYSQHHGAGPNAGMALMTGVMEGLAQVNNVLGPSE